MESVKVKDLPPEARHWLQSAMHVDLAGKDEFTLRLHPPIFSPSPDQRAAARQNLRQVLDKLDERTKDLPAEDMDAAVDEALQHVRSRRS